MNFKEISNKYSNINLKYIKYFNNIINYNSINALKYLLEHKTIVYSFESFIEKYNINNFDIYLTKYPNLNDFEICKIIHKDIIQKEYISSLEYKVPLQKKNLKIAHIFIHLFEVGGGEKYLSNFHKYNTIDPIYDEILFIKNDTKTLFSITNNIIIYETYQNLNSELKNNNYDIIIDHQLYWYENEITKTAFKDIDKSKILRITHGVPIHHQDITDFEYYYSLELYNDMQSHSSWNTHIKFYNPLGINNSAKTNNNLNIIDKIKPTKSIKISIVGRICPHKVPYDFLESLIKFIKSYENKHIKYYFYGPIDESYKKAFLDKIAKYPHIIKYKGIINDENIYNEVYSKTHILLHPSLNEAGATVVLEAMSYGIPVICRSTGGLKEAIGSGYKLFSNNNDEFFKNILKITNNIGKKEKIKENQEIYEKNILKVLLNNNEVQHFCNLFDNINLIHTINNETEIPNIIHYIYGLKEPNEKEEDFNFVYFISIYSNYVINKPKAIFFHYQYEPIGFWWNQAKKYLTLNYINTTNLYWGNKKIIKYAHKADKIRLEILYKYGGIYMDIDTINVQSYSHLLKNDLVMGIQEFQNNLALLCNALIFAKKESVFIKKWMESYEEHFVPEGWCEASVHLPYKIYLVYKDLYDFSNILFLPETSFYKPSYKNVDEIFEKNIYSNNNIDENKQMSKDLITLHYWNTFSEKYYHLINDFRYSSNTYYGYLLNNIKLLHTQKYYNDKYTFYDNSSIKSSINSYITKLNSKSNTYYTISVILNVNDNSLNNNELYNSLYSLLNQDYNEYFSMEIIIIINNNNLKNNLQNNNELKDLCKIKNVKITIITLFEHSLLSSLSKYTIGLNLSNNNYILFMDSNDSISSNKIIYQCLKHDSIKKRDFTMLFNNIESTNNYSIFFEKNNIKNNTKYYYQEYDLFIDNNIYYDKTILSKRINDENTNNSENKINSFYLNYVNSISRET
jgi:glycosyltransferase involved in cell wall biosynthesis